MARTTAPSPTGVAPGSRRAALCPRRSVRREHVLRSWRASWGRCRRSSRSCGSSSRPPRPPRRTRRSRSRRPRSASVPREAQPPPPPPLLSPPLRLGSKSPRRPRS
uniref:Uncharacterized protein n=1 Tax=Zea mays TaxID=4577 RepID=C4IZE6_MAIZE|nr:unknown [Zea mays]ACR36145.1 unknown [Zea mays]